MSKLLHLIPKTSFRHNFTIGTVVKTMSQLKTNHVRYKLEVISLWQNTLVLIYKQDSSKDSSNAAQRSHSKIKENSLLFLSCDLHYWREHINKNVVLWTEQGKSYVLKICNVTDLRLYKCLMCENMLSKRH